MARSVQLRSVEAADIEMMYGVENDIHNWTISGTTQPMSRYLFERFVESQQCGDIYATRQLRLIVVGEDGESVGIVDLFEFDPYNHRCGVGIIIFDSYRGRGYGCATMESLHRYCREQLQLHQLWCGVGSNNEASIRLFEGMGYRAVGTKRDWLWSPDGYSDEIMMQCIIG